MSPKRRKRPHHKRPHRETETVYVKGKTVHNMVDADGKPFCKVVKDDKD